MFEGMGGDVIVVNVRLQRPSALEELEAVISNHLHMRFIPVTCTAAGFGAGCAWHSEPGQAPVRQHPAHLWMLLMSCY